MFATGFDDLLIEAAKQVPSLVVLVLVVIRFLAHITATEQRREKLDEVRLKSFQDYATLCHSFQEQISTKQEAQSTRVVSALERNTESMGRNTQALSRFEAAIRAQKQQ